MVKHKDTVLSRFKFFHPLLEKYIQDKLFYLNDVSFCKSMYQDYGSTMAGINLTVVIYTSVNKLRCTATALEDA